MCLNERFVGVLLVNVLVSCGDGISGSGGNCVMIVLVMVVVVVAVVVVVIVVVEKVAMVMVLAMVSYHTSTKVSQESYFVCRSLLSMVPFAIVLRTTSAAHILA